MGNKRSVATILAPLDHAVTTGGQGTTLPPLTDPARVGHWEPDFQPYFLGGTASNWHSQIPKETTSTVLDGITNELSFEQEAAVAKYVRQALANGDLIDYSYLDTDKKSDSALVRAFIAHSHIGWNGASTGNTYAEHFHHAANAEFGLGYSSEDLQKAYIDPEASEPLVQALRLTMRAEYTATQRYLRDHQITGVRLYRGMRASHESRYRAMGVAFDGSTTRVDIKARPLTSFSTSTTTARAFTNEYEKKGILLAVDVPAKNIFSLGGITGAGVYGEQEFVTLQANESWPATLMSWSGFEPPSNASFRHAAQELSPLKAKKWGDEHGQ